MLVPSTFTGWYKKTMMTSARPMAISKSRVHTRISCRKESSEGGCSEEVLGEILAELFEFTLDAPGFSSECSISLPRIYNMSVAERARFRFCLQPAGQRPNWRRTALMRSRMLSKIQSGQLPVAFSANQVGFCSRQTLRFACELIKLGLC